MLTVWLARHGEAEAPAGSKSDSQRTLTTAGRGQLQNLALWLASRVSSPELFLHSPLLRAQQTAQVLAETMGAGTAAVQLESLLAPGIDPQSLLQSLTRGGHEKILCVGHQPDVSQCLSNWVGGGHFLYAPGTVAQIEFEDPIQCGGGHLRWITDPAWFY